nr:unnamed protein product [Spirometra erinaceieuropaei]
MEGARKGALKKFWDRILCTQTLARKLPRLRSKPTNEEQISLAPLSSSLPCSPTGCRVGIAALSEIRFSEQGQLEEVSAGYTFFWSGHPTVEQRDTGVLFTLRKDIAGRLPRLP